MLVVVWILGGILVAVFCAVLLDSRPFEERVMSGRRLAPRSDRKPLLLLLPSQRPGVIQF